MKRYEYFNGVCKENITVEKQAAGMMLHRIIEDLEIELDIDEYLTHYDFYLDWLNEEAE